MKLIKRTLQHKLFQNAFIYTGAEIFNRVIPFIMLPFFTRFLTPEDYGIVSSFTTFETILEIFVGMSVNGAININYFKMSKERLRVYIANSMIVLAGSFFLFLLIVIIFHPLISERMLIPVKWSIAAVFLALMNYVTQINMTLWRCEQKAKAYATYQVSQTFVNIGISAVLIIFFGMGWTGRLMGMAVAYLIFSFGSFAFILKRGFFRLELNWADIKDALSFGVPYIPHVLSGWAKNGVDRVILINLVGAKMTGLYSVGYQFGQIIGILAASFNRAWIPHLYEILKKNPPFEKKLRIVKFTYLYYVGLLVLALGVGIFFPIVMSFVVGEKFEESKSFVLYIAIAYAFNGMYGMAGNYVLYEKKVKTLASITFSVSVVHAILVYFLVKQNGAVGAAQASVISFFLHFAIVWIASMKIFPMPWSFRNHE